MWNHAKPGLTLLLNIKIVSFTPFAIISQEYVPTDSFQMEVKNA